MRFNLSTRWNAHRHIDGEAMLTEILELGFDGAELGYNLTRDLLPGVRRMREAGAIQVDSIHCYCPIPVGSPYGHPELFLLSSKDQHARENAVWHITQSLRFGAEMGARIMVLHGGYVEMRSATRKLMALIHKGKRNTPKYDKALVRAIEKRHQYAPTNLQHLKEGLERLAPVIDECGVRIALENLPSWEAIPSETEIPTLLDELGTARYAYWHDFGHAQIRHNLGLLNHKTSLDRLAPYLGGVHIHDVLPPLQDHAMPPDGEINFNAFRTIGNSDIVRVFEPSAQLPAETVKRGLDTVRAAWDTNDTLTNEQGDV